MHFLNNGFPAPQNIESEVMRIFVYKNRAKINKRSNHEIGGWDTPP